MGKIITATGGRDMGTSSNLKGYLAVFILFFISQKQLLSTQETPQNHAASMKIVFLDTANREKYLYKPCFELLESTGWQVDYRPIDQVMDFSIKGLNLPQYKAAFFILSIEFLKGIGKSPVAEKILLLMQRYCKLPNRLVGLIFPPLPTNPHLNLLAGFAPIFNCLGVNTPEKPPSFPNLLEEQPIQPQDAFSAARNLHNKIEAFFYMTNIFIATPLESRPLAYHTTLNPPRQGISFFTKDINRILSEADFNLRLLPLGNHYSETVKKTFPYGLYWFNPLHNNHVFIAQNTLFSFSGISESFHFCPMDDLLRKEMHRGIQHMFQELTMLVKNFDHDNEQHSLTAIESPSDFQVPSIITASGAPLEKDFPAQNHKIAWLDLTVFEEKKLDTSLTTTTTSMQQQQDLLIQYIFESGLDTLWITINPHAYYSPIARHKTNEPSFIKGLSLFTQKLTQTARQKNKKIPYVLVGFEIANNLYEPNLPKQPSLDLYGSSYRDLPSSLDRNFWYNEIKKPLAIFLAKWKKPSISHGVPISGFVLDLEMYGRKTSGQFLTPMGFDQASFNRFAKQHRLQNRHLPVHERVRLLMQLKRTSQYFSFLENDAQALGQELKTFFSKYVNNCIIACYTPSILVGWFYKGFCKGLSSPQHPLQLFTFNAEFQGHKRWFELNNIAIQHASVLLLSKISTPEDFTLVDTILKHHDGIWFNRFSRMVEPKTADWTAIERPLIDEEAYSAFCSHINDVQ